MRKAGLIVAVSCMVCLIVPFEGRGVSVGMAHRGQRLTAQEAIAVARHKARKPGSSFTVLREIIANPETRRVGDEALKQAQAHKIELFKKGILADLSRSGGFLIAETDPRTSNVTVLHLVSLGVGGIPKDIYLQGQGVKLAAVREIIKDTADFTRQMYLTPATDAASLAARFYGGSFPKCSGFGDCSLFGVPDRLLKLGADPNEPREVVALYGGFQLLGFQYALSMPVFAASPLAAIRETGPKWQALRAEFLRNNHLDPDFHFDPENIHSKKQLRERIDVLRRLDTFMEEALKSEINGAVAKTNLSIATIPLGFGADTENGRVLYSSGTASLITIYWRRLPAGGLVVKYLGGSG